MEKGQGSVSLLGGAALLLASAVSNPLSGLHSPLGAAWSWPLGAGCPTLQEQMSVLSESACKIPEQGQDFYRRPTGAIATRVGLGEKKQPYTLSFLFPVGFCRDQTCECRRERSARCIWGRL